MRFTIGFLCSLLVWPAQAAAVVSSLSELVAKVSPSVVSIQTTRFVESSTFYTHYVESFLSPPAATSPKSNKGIQGIATKQQTALGSGFVVLATNEVSEAQGIKLRDVFLLTNHHVIAGAQGIEIQLAGSQLRFQAVIVGSDAVSDVAVLKSRLPASIQPLEMGASKDVKVGESVFAIGNPFGLGHTVTSGIISAKDRSLGLGGMDRYLQTDAAINFGNSGGPLFNDRGQVIGMNTLIRADAHGIGFAIPSDEIKKIVPSLQKGQALARTWIGIQARLAQAAWLAQYNLKSEGVGGVLVTGIYKGSPAAEAGLKEGDLIREIKTGEHSNVVHHPLEIKDWVESYPAGDTVEMIVQRGEKTFLARVKVDKLPEAILKNAGVYESY